MKVAFIGLGVMGYPMAGHLKKAGHDVTVYNRNPAKAAQWVAEYGGASAPTPGGAAKGQEIVFCCVGRDSDLRQGGTCHGGVYKDGQTSRARGFGTAYENGEPDLHRWYRAGACRSL